MEISPKNVFGRYRFQYRLLEKLKETILKRSLEEVNNCDPIIMNVSKYPLEDVTAIRQELETRGFNARLITDDQGKFVRRVSIYKEEVVQYERILLRIDPFEPVIKMEGVNEVKELSTESRPVYKGPQ